MAKAVLVTGAGSGIGEALTALRFAYNLASDACIVNRFVSRFLPWSIKAAMNRRIFRLEPIPQ